MLCGAVRHDMCQCDGRPIPHLLTLNTNDGLSDDHILQLLQLPDGRILAVFWSEEAQW